jgi:hypothetical protein
MSHPYTPDLTTMSEASRRFKVSRRTLQRWVKAGSLRKTEDGKVNAVVVKALLETFQESPRRGPVPGCHQFKLDLDVELTPKDKRLMRSEHRSAQLIERHIPRLHDVVLTGILLDQLQKRHTELVGQMQGLAAALGQFRAEQKAKAAATSSASSSAPAPAGVPASAPAQ